MAYQTPLTPQKWGGEEGTFAMRIRQNLEELFGWMEKAKLKLKTLESGKVSKVKVSVTLESDDWVNNAQTLAVSGVLAGSAVLANPASASYSAWYAAGVRISAQAAGAITFTCSLVPSADLTAEVIILN